MTVPPLRQSDSLERRDGWRAIYEITGDAVADSPPMHYSDQMAEAWCEGRDAAIAHIREDLKFWADIWDLIEKPAEERS